MKTTGKEKHKKVLKLKKKISNEVIITALLEHGTIKATAEALSITRRTIYQHMDTAEFKELYKSAKAEIVRNAVFKMSKNIDVAIDTVVEIMTDKENNSAIRLQASQTIINTAIKFISRLTEGEEELTKQQEENRIESILNF